MELGTLRERIREAIRSGTLPCHRSWRTWAGPGTGRTCSACASDVTPDQVEYEVEFSEGDSILVHIECYQSWVEECHAQLSEPDGRG